MQVSISALFGRILAGLRADKGLTQRDFRQLSRMRPGAIERLETGRATLSVGHLIKAARVFQDPELLPLEDGEALDLSLSSTDLLRLLLRCATHLREQHGVRVYLEGRPYDDLEELVPPRLDRLIAEVIDEYLVVDDG